MPESRFENINALVRSITGGKPYVFVAMSFNAHWDFYKAHVRDIVRETTGLLCIRADEVPGSGLDLLAKVHLLIDGADLVIAEISHNSPNVFYEVGYAVGAKRPTMVIAKRGIVPPADLQGLELLTYDDGSRDGLDLFDQRFRDHLRVRLNSDVSDLRDMLEGPRREPVYILASPKNRAGLDHAENRRTFGDDLGVMGLIRTFGQLMGEHAAIELISGQYGSPDLIQDESNIYLIGSPKVNKFTRPVMDSVQSGCDYRWHFTGDAPDSRGKDYEVGLALEIQGKVHPLRSQFVFEGQGRAKYKVWMRDYGLIMRAPHPKVPGRIVCLMAGPHSLGSGAACIAATSTSYIKRIREILGDEVVADKQSAFWVLVEGTAEKEGVVQRHKEVRVLNAGLCGEPGRARQRV